MKNLNRKNHSWKKLVIVSVLVLVGALVFIVAESLARLYLINASPLPVPKPQLITASPVDLNQVIGFSKFRSCSGHDYSGKDDQGIIESNVSMKHYVFLSAAVIKSGGKAELFAPYNGKIAAIYPDGGEGGRPKTTQIFIQADADANYAMSFFHAQPLTGIKKGVAVKTGQLIGYADLTGGANYDIVFHHLDRAVLADDVAGLFYSPFLILMKSDYLMSYFDYMTPQVAAEYKAEGFDLSDMTIGRAYRKAHPCSFGTPAAESDFQFLPGQNPNQQEKPSQPYNMMGPNFSTAN